MPVKVTCNPADLPEMSEVAEELDLDLEVDWRMKPGLVRLTVVQENDGTVVIPFGSTKHRGFERWRRQW